MPTKRELIVGLVGLLLGAGATVAGVKTDALSLCAGVDKGIVVGEKIGPMISKLMDAGTALDAGIVVDAGVPGVDAGK